MKLLLNLTGVLTFMTGVGAFLSLRWDNIPIAIVCLVWSALCFYFASNHD
jgi:hypothetical protein